MTLIEKITKQCKEKPCQPAIEWIEENNFQTFQEVWVNCKISGWALWWLEKLGYNDQKVLRLMAVSFAREVQHLMKDQRSIDALNVAERYANGEATEEEFQAARNAARYASWGAARYASWGAARNDAWDAARYAARYASWAGQCGIIRRFIPNIDEVIQKLEA
jgi:hypothetical protein